MENTNMFQKLGMPTPKWAKVAAGIFGLLGSAIVFIMSLGIELSEKFDNTIGIMSAVVLYVGAFGFGAQVDQKKLKEKIEEKKKQKEVKDNEAR